MNEKIDGIIQKSEKMISKETNSQILSELR
jgi:hypothetical protein